MSNNLLIVSKEKRLNEKLKLCFKIPNFEEISKLTDVLGLENVLDYETRLQKRRAFIFSTREMANQYWEDNPLAIKVPLVFWDYAEVPLPDGTISIRYDVIVSTNGDIIKSRKNPNYSVYLNKFKPFNREDIDISENNYELFLVARRYSLIHRIVATTFLERSDHIKHIPLNKLEVNHKDKVRFHNHIENLEWVTKTANLKHRDGVKDYLDHEHYLFEVILDNGFLDRKFVVERNDKTLPKTLVILFKPKNTYAKVSGFKVINIASDKIDQYEQGFPKDIHKLYQLNPDFFKKDIRILLGMILGGEKRGTQFLVIGKKHSMALFNMPSFDFLLTDSAIRKTGCAFKEISFLEGVKLAESLKGNVDQEILSDLHHHSIFTVAYKGIVRVGKFKGYQFYILTLDDYNLYKNIKHTKLARACVFQRVCHFTVPLTYPKMTHRIYDDILKTLVKMKRDPSCSS